MLSLGRDNPQSSIRIERRGPRFWLLCLLGVAFVLSIAGQSAASRARAKAGPRDHLVYPGQTLGMIAKRYGVTLEALRAANQLKPGERIKPRQRLIVPDPDDLDGSQARKARLEAEAAQDA